MSATVKITLCYLLLCTINITATTTADTPLTKNTPEINDNLRTIKNVSAFMSKNNYVGSENVSDYSLIFGKHLIKNVRVDADKRNNAFKIKNVSIIMNRDEASSSNNARVLQENFSNYTKSIKSDSLTDAVKPDSLSLIKSDLSHVEISEQNLFNQYDNSQLEKKKTTIENNQNANPVYLISLKSHFEIFDKNENSSPPRSLENKIYPVRNGQSKNDVRKNDKEENTRFVLKKVHNTKINSERNSFEDNDTKTKVKILTEQKVDASLSETFNLPSTEKQLPVFQSNNISNSECFPVEKQNEALNEKEEATESGKHVNECENKLTNNNAYLFNTNNRKFREKRASEKSEHNKNVDLFNSNSKNDKKIYSSFKTNTRPKIIKQNVTNTNYSDNNKHASQFKTNSDVIIDNGAKTKQLLNSNSESIANLHNITIPIEVRTDDIFNRTVRKQITAKTIHESSSVGSNYILLKSLENESKQIISRTNFKMSKSLENVNGRKQTTDDPLISENIDFDVTKSLRKQKRSYDINNSKKVNIESLDDQPFEIHNLSMLNDDDNNSSTFALDALLIADDDEENATGYLNCSNAYCLDDDDYINMIEEYMFPTYYEWVLIVCHSIVFVIGLVGNALVCVAVYRNHTMRTVTNYFIVNLAVADFMVILFCLPPTVLWDVTETWFMGTAMCKVVLYLQTVSVTVSVLTLTFISVDRWYAICFPLKFKSTTSRAKTAIVIIWTVALISDIPELVVLTTEKRLKDLDVIHFTKCKVSWSNDTDTYWMICKMIFLYVCPLSLMSVAYICIVRVLWKSDNIPGHGESAGASCKSNLSTAANNRRSTFTMNANTTTEGQLRSRRKAAKMLVAVVIMFAVCYFPVHILTILQLTITIPQSDIFTALALLTHWLCYFNSAVNPIIYNFMSGKFRSEFRRAFSQCCQNREDVILLRERHSHYQLNNCYSQQSFNKGNLTRQTTFTTAAGLNRAKSVYHEIPRRAISAKQTRNNKNGTENVQRLYENNKNGASDNVRLCHENNRKPIIKITNCNGNVRNKENIETINGTNFDKIENDEIIET